MKGLRTKAHGSLWNTWNTHRTSSANFIINTLTNQGPSCQTTEAVAHMHHISCTTKDKLLYFFPTHFLYPLSFPGMCCGVGHSDTPQQGRRHECLHLCHVHRPAPFHFICLFSFHCTLPQVHTGPCQQGCPQVRVIVSDS